EARAPTASGPNRAGEARGESARTPRGRPRSAGRGLGALWAGRSGRLKTKSEANASPSSYPCVRPLEVSVEPGLEVWAIRYPARQISEHEYVVRFRTWPDVRSRGGLAATGRPVEPALGGDRVPPVE